MTQPKHQYFEDPAITRLMGMMVALAGEVFVLKAKNERLLRALKKKKVVSDKALKALDHDKDMQAWLLKEREEFLGKVRREGDEILELARARAERLVQRTEVVRTAEQRARQLVETAREETRRMRRETEDYCDQKLASFEGLLGTTRETISQGRRRLQETVLDRDRERRATEAAEAERAVDEAHASGTAPVRPVTAFFDQDAEGT